MTFHSVGNVIIPTDELIFFRGIETTNQDKKSMTNGIFMGFPRDFRGIDGWINRYDQWDSHGLEMGRMDDNGISNVNGN